VCHTIHRFGVDHGIPRRAVPLYQTSARPPRHDLGHMAAAIAAAARTHDEHKEEVAVLSEKLCQILEESDGLRALCDSQAADLKVLSDEIVRLMHAEAAPESSGGVELEGWRVGNYY